MGGKVNVSFYNQYSSKLVLLGDIYLPPPLEGPSGPPLPPWGALWAPQRCWEIYIPKQHYFELILVTK